MSNTVSNAFIYCNLNRVLGSVIQNSKTFEYYGYLDIYGIPTENFIKGNDLEIDIPNIKIANKANSPAYILFRVLEDTPGMRSETVTLYERKIKLFRISNIFNTGINIL